MADSSFEFLSFNFTSTKHDFPSACFVNFPFEEFTVLPGIRVKSTESFGTHIVIMNYNAFSPPEIVIGDSCIHRSVVVPDHILGVRKVDELSLHVIFIISFASVMSDSVSTKVEDFDLFLVSSIWEDPVLPVRTIVFIQFVG